MSYIFHDTETTGKVTAFDQSLQIASIETDAKRNVLDTFDVCYCLLPYVVPSPGVLLVTGTTVADITTCSLSAARHASCRRRTARSRTAKTIARKLAGSAPPAGTMGALRGTALVAAAWPVRQ